MMCRVNSYNEEKLDFTTRLLPLPCARLLANEDRLLLSIIYNKLSVPLAVDGHAGVDSTL